MPDKVFGGIFDNGGAAVIAVPDFLICVGVSLVIGVFLALVYTYRSRYTKSFVITLAILPAVVCVVIMMVNGNVGAGVAVAGTFSLVRFRSVPGTAKEIGVLFLAMGTGLITGMGYIAFAVLFVAIMGLVNVLYTMIDFGAKKQCLLDKTMHIMIPEDLDYTEVFDDIFEKFTQKNTLVNVKTTNMGSLFKLTYNITLKEEKIEKALIDAVRCRNGNLEITMSIQETAVTAEL